MHTYLIQMQKVFFTLAGPRIGSEGRAGCAREQGWLCMGTGLVVHGNGAGCAWEQGWLCMRTVLGDGGRAGCT